MKLDKPKKFLICPVRLAYLDSNQDKQNQNLSYYHYTIGQSVPSKRSAKIRVEPARSKSTLPYLYQPCSPGILNELEQQGRNGVQDRRRENALGSAVPVGIDIEGKQADIQDQARHRNRRDLLLIGPKEEEEVVNRKSGIKLDKIVNRQTEDRCHQPKHEAQPEVIFFEYHDFHVFSSLVLRT